MIDAQFYDLLHRATRTFAVVIVPTLAVPVVAFVFAILQGMMAIREDSIQYGLRVMALVLVLAIFGTSMTTSVLELMRFALK